MADAALDRIANVLRTALHARPPGTALDLEEARSGYDALGMMIPIVSDTTIEEVNANGVVCEWVVGPASETDRTILYFHGGCYAIGSRQSHRSMLSRLALSSGARILSVEYRLAPENRYPAALDDACSVWRWLLAQRVAPSRTTFVGDSAGGGLTLAALIVTRDAGLPLPARAVLLSPWTDLELTGPSVGKNAAEDPLLREDDLQHYAALYLGDTPPRTPLASPIHADLSGLPPLLVHVAAKELLRDDSVRLADRARAAGVDVTLEEFEDVFHVWHFFAGMALSSDAAVRRVAEFVRR